MEANYSFLNSLFSVFISYLVNLAIPRAGEISRVAVFSRYENNPFDKTLSTVVAERVVDFIILLIILGSVFLIQFETISEAITTAQAQQAAQDGGTNYLTIAILILAVLGGIFVFRNQKIKAKIKDFLVGLFDGLKSIWKMEEKAQFLGHTLIIWVLYLAMFWISIYCLPQTSHLGFGAILTAFAAGGIGTGRGMLAAMVLGADGVQIGSRFAATEESSAHINFKKKIIDVKDGDTHLTLKELAPVRLVKNKFYQQVQELYTQNPSKEQLLTLLGRARSKKGMFEGDLENGELEIGQIAGVIHQIKPAKEVLEEIIKEFDLVKSLIINV